MTPAEVDVESNPAVTVVIPAYNLSAYLRDASESVRGQTYRGPIAIIILDDGSTDNTLDVANELAEEIPGLRVHSQTNRGRAETRDRLLNLAETELIAWIDADDLAAPSWIEDQVSFLSSHCDCAAVGGQGYAMDARGHAIGPIDQHPTDHNEIDERHVVGHANAFFQSCVLTRKSKLIEAGGYRAKYPAAEDFDLWLRLAEISKLANLDQVHLYYRVHGTSANWTLNIDQRQQGHQILNEARKRRGLAPFDEPIETIPPAKKDDWNRRVYWINIALRAGNPRTALGMIANAIRRHPTSLLLWIFLFVASCDAVLFFGNRTAQFRPGSRANIRRLPTVSVYRLARFLNRKRRHLFR